MAMYCTANVEIGDGARFRCYRPPDLAIHEGDECIVEADRVLEFGRVVGLDDAGADAGPETKLPKLLRRATLQDKAKAEESALRSRMAMETCTARAEKYELKIRLIRVRYSFDRSVLMVLFTAEDRVDFREMVKELAGELRTRVEMKQVGVRDEAGMIGGLGPCGRKLCCSTWLHNFEFINVSMATTQRLSLNPGAINGMCGRLKCCLRYEYPGYKEFDKRLPRDGAHVRCPEGEGSVIDKDVLAQRVKIRLDDDRVLEHGVDDVETIGTKRKKRPARSDESGGVN